MCIVENRDAFCLVNKFNIRHSKRGIDPVIVSIIVCNVKKVKEIVGYCKWEGRQINQTEIIRSHQPVI